MSSLSIRVKASISGKTCKALPDLALAHPPSLSPLSPATPTITVTFDIFLSLVHHIQPVSRSCQSYPRTHPESDHSAPSNHHPTTVGQAIAHSC